MIETAVLLGGLIITIGMLIAMSGCPGARFAHDYGNGEVVDSVTTTPRYDESADQMYVEEYDVVKQTCNRCGMPSSYFQYEKAGEHRWSK
jgi:hypothetical protein